MRNSNKILLPTMKKILVCFAISWFSIGTFSAQAQTEINFSVNLKYADYQQGDKIVVRGSIPLLGNWTEDGQLVLSQFSKNESIFEGTLEIPDNELEAQYKFLILKGDGTEIWEDRANRSLLGLVNSGPETVYFSGRNDPGLTSTLTQVTFSLDASDMKFNGDDPEGIALMGNRGELSFGLNERKVMQEVRPGVWSTTVMLPYGTIRDLEFKFAWLLEDKWEWEYIPGHANHIALLEMDVPDQQISMKYDPASGKIIPTEDLKSIDNYTVVQEHLGETFWATNYAYGLAMKELNDNNLDQAIKTYQKYKAVNTYDSGIDDFHFHYAKHISQRDGTEAAIEFIEAKQNEEGITDSRNSYFEYLKGELWLNSGKNSKAREYFRNVMANYEGETTLAGTYSEEALTISYLYDSDEDSIRVGIQQAQQKIYKDSTKAYGWLNQIANAHKRLNDHFDYEQTLWRMSQTGTPNERSKAAIKLARKQAKERRYEEAWSTINDIDSLQVSPKVLENRDFLKVVVLEGSGKKEQASQLKTKLKEKYKGNERLKTLHEDEEGPK
ncbi:carbohydrate-binding module family 20 domain-containing protein [Gracilimonas tropica]|uniref:carbohydrate-binding module family 20 domain-containing protein n=1 Tax=Gracilimonas tropica TaxID=454600 RepID=UPI000A0385A7|nr:carbohydrate-binding module family 20 domain-containing protein [Gracilimonas tropica]